MRNVIGGILDGAIVQESDQAFGWIDETGRVFNSPAPGRAAYKYVFGAWVSVRRCACGCYLQPDPESGATPDPCPLCGHDQRSPGDGPPV